MLNNNYIYSYGTMACTTMEQRSGIAGPGFHYTVHCLHNDYQGTVEQRNAIKKLQQ